MKSITLVCVIKFGAKAFRSSVNRRVKTENPYSTFAVKGVINDEVFFFRNNQANIYLFKVNNKDTRTTSKTYFTPSYTVSIGDLEQVNVNFKILISCFSGIFFRGVHTGQPV